VGRDCIPLADFQSAAVSRFEPAPQNGLCSGARRHSSEIANLGASPSWRGHSCLPHRDSSRCPALWKQAHALEVRSHWWSRSQSQPVGPL